MGLVLFDFDYTLADSSTGIVDCFRYALKSAGLPIPDEHAMLRTIGMPLHDAFVILAPDGCPQHLRSLYKERSDMVMVDSTAFYDGVPKLMAGLRSRGYQTGIVSTKYRHRIEQILERDGFTDLFDIVIGGDDVANFKPHPEGLEKAARELGCDKESVVYVGDTVIDAKAASTFGAKFIAVTTGVTPRDDLNEFGPLAVVDRVIDILHYLPAVGATT